MSNAITQDSVATASALLKTVYGEYIDALPEQEIVVPKTSQVKSVKIGSRFQEAVNLEFGHSVTAIGDNDQVTTLAPPSYTPIQTASVVSYVFDYREVLTQTIIERAREGQQAFASATVVSMERAQKSMTRILEELYMYGTQGLGSFTGVTAQLNNNQVQFDEKEFAPGVSVGAKNMPIDIYNNTTGVKVLSTVVSSVTFPTSNSSTAIWTLDSVSGLANGTVYSIYRRGFKGLQPSGLYDILIGSNNLYGISGAEYDLWAPNAFNAQNTSLNYKSIVLAVQNFKAKGLAKKLFGIASEEQYTDLVPTYNALTFSNSNPGPRSGTVFTDRKGDLQFGTNEVKFFVNSIELEIAASSYQKNGYFWGVDFDTITRVGSTEKPFIMKALPGASGGKDEIYLRPIPNSTLYEFQLWSDTTLFTSERNRHFAIYNIVPGTAT